LKCRISQAKFSFFSHLHRRNAHFWHAGERFFSTPAKDHFPTLTLASAPARLFFFFSTPSATTDVSCARARRPIAACVQASQVTLFCGESETFSPVMTLFKGQKLDTFSPAKVTK